MSKKRNYSGFVANCPPLCSICHTCHRGACPPPVEFKKPEGVPDVPSLIEVQETPETSEPQSKDCSVCRGTGLISGVEYDGETECWQCGGEGTETTDSTSKDIPVGPYEDCTDCGTKMVWQYDPTDPERGNCPSWMCPNCVLRRMDRAEKTLLTVDAKLIRERAAHEETKAELGSMESRLYAETDKHEETKAKLSSYRQQVFCQQFSEVERLKTMAYGLRTENEKLKEEIAAFDEFKQCEASLAATVEENEKLRELCKESVQIQQDVTGDLHDRIKRIEAVEKRAKELGVIE